MGTVHRVFCGKQKNISSSGASYLIDTFGLALDSKTALKRKDDLPIVLLPGKRAIRTLRDHMISYGKGSTLYYPGMITPGGLPELLIAFTGRYASTPELTAAYVQALQELDRETLSNIFARGGEALRDHEWWSIAEELIRYYKELSAASIKDEDLLEVVLRLSEHSSLEQSRWETFFSVRDRANDILKEIGLRDKDDVRREFLLTEQEPLPHKVLVIGVPELSPIVQRFLHRCQEVCVLVQADEVEAESLDEFGQAIVSSWIDQTIDYEGVDVLPTQTVQDEALCIARACRRYAEERSFLPVICTADSSRQEMIAHRLKDQGLSAHYTEGLQVSRSSLASFLRCLLASVNHGEWHAGSPLFRHPYVAAWYEDVSKLAYYDVLTDIDRKYAEYLYADRYKETKKLPDVVDAIQELLLPLREKELSLSEWPEVMAEIVFPFIEAYRRRLSQEDQEHLYRCYTVLQEVFLEFSLIPSELSASYAGSVFLNVALKAFSSRAAGIQARGASIEMLGWLEILHDAGSDLFLAGVNEGMLPESITSDAWLPHAVRDALGIQPNNQRYVRDLFILSRLIESRDSIVITYALQGERAEPLKPGRILYAVPQEVLGARVEALFRCYDVSIDTSDAEVVSSLIIPPEPRKDDTKKTDFSVSEISQYLRDPYRYYLRYVESLQNVHDEEKELNSMQFGSIAHEVLERFAATERRRTISDRKEMNQFFQTAVASVFNNRFGGLRSPALQIQELQLTQRLSRFAEWQSSWIQSGCKILEVEKRVEFSLSVDGVSVRIRGTIDRIDSDPDGTLYLFDYKTFDTAKTPASTHYRNSEDRWLDVQLPLYRYALLQVQEYKGRTIVPGYIPISDPGKEYKHELLDGKDWDEERFKSALQATEQAIRGIWLKDYTPSETTRYLDEYSSILGEGQRVDPRYLWKEEKDV